MILLDTHVWVWWLHGAKELSRKNEEIIKINETNGLAVSIISFWEVAKLVENRRLILPVDLKTWYISAMGYPYLNILQLIPEIIIDSTQLPGNFHKDPADQLIVATARINKIPILTADKKILDYPHVGKV